MRSSLLFVFLCLAAAPAAGHPLDMSRLDVQVEQERVLQRLTIREDSVAQLLGPDWSRLPPDELRTAVFSATLGASNLSAGGEPWSWSQATATCASRPRRTAAPGAP